MDIVKITKEWVGEIETGQFFVKLYLHLANKDIVCCSFQLYPFTFDREPKSDEDIIDVIINGINKTLNEYHPSPGSMGSEEYRKALEEHRG